MASLAAPQRQLLTELACIGLLSLSFAASPALAQTPVNPTPVLSTGALTREPKLSGYISVRETIRDDTMTFIINRARIGVQALPASFAALKLQVDFSALGRTSGDTVPAVLITDAYVQLMPTDTGSRVVQLLRPALLIGQFKTPFSIEYLTSTTGVITANRSLGADRLSPRRDRGFYGYIRFPKYATLSGAVVDGEGSNRVTNPDGKQMAIGRFTVLPIPTLSVSAKWAGQGSDHRWGYDARWSSARAVLEGEVIEREGPTNSTTEMDATARYALVAVRALPWLQPIVKWERLAETLTTATTSSSSRITLTTIGVNLLSPDDRFRAQLNWVDRAERPVDRKGEFIAQFQAAF
jgi:hypothetical protein